MNQVAFDGHRLVADAGLLLPATLDTGRCSLCVLLEGIP
jgi:hypothetical protein